MRSSKVAFVAGVEAVPGGDGGPAGSVPALWGLREFASKDDDVVVPVGANRYVGQVAVVTEPISGVGTVGRVRLETENWMAITDNNEHIPAGAVVTVSAVRGARLVVHAG